MEFINREIEREYREIENQTNFRLISKDEIKSCWKLEDDFNCLNCGTHWKFEMKFDLFLDGVLFGETWNVYDGGEWSKSDDFTSWDGWHIDTIKHFGNDFYRTINSAKKLCYMCREV